MAGAARFDHLEAHPQWPHDGSVTGNDSAQLDMEEWIQFTFADPMFRVSYQVTSVTHEYVPISYEVYSPLGEIVASKNSELQANDTFSLNEAEYDKVSGFKVSADNSGAGHSIGAMEFWGTCL